MGKTIGIVSLKGGVGKTSTVISLGVSLAKKGKKVLLIDANFSAPNLGIHLNIVEPEYTLTHVINREANIDKAIYSFYQPGELDILPTSMFKKLKRSPTELRNKIRNIKRKYDIILIDSSPSLNEETLAAMIASDEILVVSTPDYSTLATTIKSVKIAKQRNTPITGIVLNKVYNKNFEIPLDEIERASDSPVMAVIPHDKKVLKSQSEFIPPIETRVKKELKNEYEKLASLITGEKQKKTRNPLRHITPKRQDINREIFYESAFQ